MKVCGNAPAFRSSRQHLAHQRGRGQSRPFRFCVRLFPSARSLPPIAIPTGLVHANSATNGRGQPYTNYTLSFIDNLTVIHGSHTMKFGGEVRPVRMYTDRQGGTTYTFSNISSFLSNQPSSIQYLGDVSAPSPFNNGATGLRDLRQAYYVFFAQDEWKIRPALTINYGLRYEYYSVLHEAENRAVTFNMATRTIAQRGTPW